MESTEPDYPLVGWRAYAAAALLLLGAFLVRVALDPLLGAEIPFASFFLAVMFAAWWGGPRVAVFTWITSMLVSIWFFVTPRYTFVVTDLWPAVVYTAVSAAIVVLVTHARGLEISARRNAAAVTAARADVVRQNVLLTGLADAVLDGILIVSPDGRMLYANERFREIWGFPPGTFDDEQRALAWAETRVADPRAFREGVAATYATRATVHDELALADGRVFERYGAPIIHDGTHFAWVWTLRDITARKRDERQLAAHSADLERIVQARTRELTETVRELEAFSYSLSHDMRAPLRAMKGFAQLLQHEYAEALGERGNLYLDRISRAAGRLDQLIQDVLMYSRIVRQQVGLEPIDVDRLIRQLVDENPALQPPKATITVDGPLHPVMGHEAYLMQVLSNLVYNAVKFMPPGRHPEVRIWTEVRGDRVRLSVCDNGIGVPLEAQERIFGMFERLHGERQYEGTGIGLSIVKKAVERMGGEVGLTSRPDCGSTFWVELPKPP